MFFVCIDAFTTAVFCMFRGVFCVYFKKEEEGKGVPPEAEGRRDGVLVSSPRNSTEARGVFSFIAGGAGAF